MIFRKRNQAFDIFPKRSNRNSQKNCFLLLNHISYGYKYLNRSELEALYKLRGSCDDILIVKEGCLSDSYYANIAFWDGRDWFTPDTPLLPGTMRAALLDQGLLQVARIVPGDMKNFQKIRLINAMNDLNEGSEIPMDKITM